MAYENIESLEKRLDEFQGNMDWISSQLLQFTNMMQRSHQEEHSVDEYLEG